MSGGWSTGDGRRLADRLARTPPAVDTSPPTVVAGSPGHPRTQAPGPTGKHCWLLDDDGGWHPGLLLEWRQVAEGWAGRIAYATPGTDSAVLHEQWLPATRLKRADTDV